MDRKFDAFDGDIGKRLQRSYPELTDADLIWRYDTKEDYLEMIALKLGKTKREMARIIEDL